MNKMKRKKSGKVMFLKAKKMIPSVQMDDCFLASINLVESVCP